MRLRMTARGPSLEPQGDAVPGSPEETRGRDALERDHRILPERPALVRDAQRRDALARGERRDQGLLADDLRLQLVRRARGYRHEEVRGKPRAQSAFAAFPHHEFADLLVLRVKAEGLVGLETEIEQLLALLGTQPLRGCADEHRHQPPFAAPRRSDEAIAGAFGVPGLHAV